MKIEKANRHYLHNEEWLSMYVDYRLEVDKYGAATLKIKPLYDLFLPLFDKADKHLLVLRKSVFTQQMKEADKDRKVSFQSLVNTTHSMLALNQSEPAKKAAAIRMNNLLTQYKQRGVKGGYDEETSGVYNLLQDLDGQYRADVTLLNMTDWVEALRQAETRFTAARAQRMKENTEKPLEPLADIRLQVDGLYDNMMNIIDAQLVIDGLGGDVVVDPNDLKTGIYEEDTPEELKGNVTYNFAVSWNVVVKHYRDLLAARSGRAAAKKKDPETSDPGTTPDPEPNPSWPVED